MAVNSNKEKVLDKMAGKSNFMLALAMIGILVVMIVPLPFILLDLLG